MFGYVRAANAELRVREYETYRAAYCGLCRSMGKCTGQCSRMTLSYDFAFLVLLRVCLEGASISFKRRRCVAHPLKKRSMMEQNETLDYCARAAALLNYHKIRDDLSDEKGFKRLRAMIAYPFVAHARRKALRAGLEELDAALASELSRLSKTEAQRLVSVDTPAAVFGDILALIISWGLEGAEARIGAQIGRSVGRWIYVVDALDDMREDKQRERYNPFLMLYGGRVPTADELEGIGDALKVGLCSAEAALDLMQTDMDTLRSIIENILFLGMPDTADKILDKLSGGNPEKDDKCEKAEEAVVEEERNADNERPV